jgi:peptidoglycan-associated lipoprotein
MKKKYIIIIASFFCLTAIAKTPKADRLFERWEYFRAAKLYEKEAAKHPDADVYFKLGECYRKMNKYKEEQMAYDKVNAKGTYSKPEFYLNYGLVLKNNGNYEAAKIAFNKYTELVPADPRGKFFSESIDIATEDHKFDEPVKMSNVASLNTEEADFSPVLYRNGIVFASARKTDGHGKTYGWTGSNYLDLYYAKKGVNDTIYSDVTPFGGKNLDKQFHDGPACFTKNCDTIYTSRVAKDLRGEEKKTLNIERNKIFMSTLKDGNWTKETPFFLNSDSFSVANPYLTTDGSRIYFVSDMPGGFGETDIYYCNRVGSTWSKPINMGPNVNTFNREKFPSLDSSGNFYFASDGYQGFGGLDICVALNKNGSLEKAIPMKSPINSVTDDYGIAFLKGGKTGYISSNRYQNGKGDDDILYFDLSGTKDLTASVYTIGYKPAIKEQDIAITPDVVLLNPISSSFTKPVSFGFIYFDYDKSNIRPDAISRLDSIVAYLKEFPDMNLVMGGHCDNHGTPEYNIALSNQRDASTVHYLISKGIKANRMVAKGYGLTQMVNRCEVGVICNDAEQQLNRRVEFYFSGKKAQEDNIQVKK